MANPQPDKFIRLSTELYEAIMRFDFSKRQRNILDLVIRFSYGCGKKSALLRPSDFQQCGVGRTHIKKELETLAKANVLFVDGEVIQLNKNYEEWKIKVVPGFDQKKWSEILKRNLVVPETVTEVPKTGTISEMGTKVTETGTGVTKMGTDENMFGSQNGNSEVPKMGTDTPPEPSNDAGFEHPIDNTIDNYLFNTTDDNDDDNIGVPPFGIDQTEPDPRLAEVRNHFIKRSQRIWFNPLEEKTMADLIDEGIPVEIIKKGIDLAFDRFTPRYKGHKIKSFNYCVDIIRELYEAEKQGGDRYETRTVRFGRDQKKDRGNPEVAQGYYEQYADILFAD